jgi:hypothetical protein
LIITQTEPCGDQCCDADQICCNGRCQSPDLPCCPSSQTPCGGGCCSEGQTCCNDRCRPAGLTCCAPDQTVCGDQCCNTGQTCCSGVCLNFGTDGNCNGACASCNPGQHCCVDVAGTSSYGCCESFQTCDPARGCV